MQLMTKKIRNKIPKLGEQADKGADAIIHVKFFTPDSSWTWYASEGEFSLTWYASFGIELIKEIFEYDKTILCDLWDINKTKAFPCTITAFDLWDYLQKQIDSSNSNSERHQRAEESQLERWKISLKRLLVFVRSESPEQLSELCQTGELDYGGIDREVFEEKRDGTPQRRGQNERQSGQSTTNDERVSSGFRDQKEKGEGGIQKLPQITKEDSGAICKINDFEFFGLVDGFEKEFGYFSLKELRTYTGPMGMKIERDLYFGTPTMGEIYPEFFEKSEIPA